MRTVEKKAPGVQEFRDTEKTRHPRQSHRGTWKSRVSSTPGIRAVAGSPLHTNFKLKSGGEYLALTRGLDPASVQIVSEFDPEYPFQFTDISYGIGQAVRETTVASATAPAKYFVPGTDALGVFLREPHAVPGEITRGFDAGWDIDGEGGTFESRHSDGDSASDEGIGVGEVARS